jgi:exonuclease VII large subunit
MRHINTGIIAMSDNKTASLVFGSKRLSPVPVNPDTQRADPTKLAPHQEALRQAMLNVFTAQKARRSLERQVQHISPNRNLAEGIKILFDNKGKPPENVPLEDIVEERRRLEYHVMWFEGILAELRNRLVRVKEVEDYAFEMLSRAAAGE